MSRRSLLRRGGALALTAGVGAALAGVRTPPRRWPRRAPEATGRGILGDPTAGGPVDSAGIPLARKDYPVVLPRRGEAVKSSAKPESGGELQIFNYPE